LIQQRGNIIPGSITGVVLDDTKQPLPSAVIEIYRDTVLKNMVATDINGMYSIENLEPGAYHLIAVYVGLDTVDKVITITDKPLTLDLIFSRTIIGTSVQGVPVKPIIDMDNPTKRTFSREEIDHIPH